MLPKRRKLTAAEVREVIARGRSSRSGSLSMKFLAIPEMFRVAAVVSKKTARLAVARNTLRRSLYRALAKVPSPARGHAVVFVLSPATTTRFEEDARALFSKMSA